MRLREKILLPVVGLFLVVVGGVGALALAQAGSLFRERSAQALDLEARTAARHIDDWFADRKHEIEAFAKLDYVANALQDPATRPDAGRQFAQTVRSFPYGQALALIDASGTVVASDDPARLGKDYSGRDYFKESMGGATTISSPFLSKTTGRPVVAVSTPVALPDGKPGGVLYFNVGLDRFADQFLSSFEVDSFSFAFAFLPEDGKIVAHPDSTRIFAKPVDSLDAAAAIRDAARGASFPREVDGRAVLVEHAPISEAGWELGVIHDLETENHRLSIARWTLAGLSLLAAILASIIVVVWIVRPMTTSLLEAIHFARAVGEGDTSMLLQTRSSDEIGDLVRTLSAMGENLRAKNHAVERVASRDLTVDVVPLSARDLLGGSLRTMVANLREVIGKAGKGAAEAATAAETFQRLSLEVAGAAEETSSQSTSLARSAELVHRNVHAVAAGTEEMGASIREIAKSASEATLVASDALAKADRTNEIVAKLGEASTQIGTVVGVIQGIANQTNLLALNATIEAARAGEAGKGFAVVAGEVKELSKATREATEDIASRIQAIQSEMVVAVSSIQEISDVIRKVNDLSQSIAAAVEEQTAATSEIAQSLADATRGIGEINTGLGQAAEAADQTARSAAEIRTGSESLRKHASNVSESVNAFRIA